MTIITVVDDDYFIGREFAKKVASKLGFQFVDGEILVESAVAWGGERERLHRACEQPPRFLHRFFRSKQVHVLQLRAALAKDIQEGNIVCYGAAADLLNLRSSQILRVRVKSSFESRLRLVQQQMGLNFDEARKYLQEGERKREQWRTHLHESASATSPGPGLLVNLDKEGIDQACRTVLDMIECRVRSQPKNQDAASTRKWVLVTAIRAAIAQRAETRNFDFDVAVEGDAVVLSLIPPASDGGSFPVRLAPSMGRVIQAALAQQPGTRDLRPEVTVKGDAVVLRGIMDDANESLGFEPVSANVEANSVPSQADMAAPGSEFFSRHPWLDNFQKSLILFRGQGLPLRFAAVATVIGAVIIAALIFGGLMGRKRWQPPDSVQLQSLLGVITDSTCGLIHKTTLPSANCVRSCVQSGGAKFALGDDGHIIVISNQQAAETFAARKVFVTGTLDASSGELHITSIRLATP